MTTAIRPPDAEIRELARSLAHMHIDEDDIEVDHDAEIHYTDEDNGAWVQSWIWVSFNDKEDA